MTTIAIVDDHELVRDGLISIINSFGEYTVVLAAQNGRDFIEQISGRKIIPEIVLLDIAMPILNGYDTAVWIKSNLPQTKILVLSMMDNDSAIIRMVRNGATGYILKDSNSKFFKQALDNIKMNGYYINDLVTGKLLHWINSENTNLANGYFGPYKLSDKELCFLKLACSEKTYKEIADEMCVSPRTIDSYRDSLFEKLQIKSRVGLAIFAIKNGIATI